MFTLSTEIVYNWSMKLIAYLRVSTAGQVKDGLGLPTQERMVRAWAKSSGHKLVGVQSENGKSGTLAEIDRPGLLDALSAVKRRDASGIVVTSLDRLARTLTIQEAILAEVWKLDGRVFSVDSGEIARDDPDDPMRSAMRQMAGVFAELDRKLVIKRLRNGRMTKANAGGHAVGRAPYGWKAEDGELVTDEKEQEIIAAVVEWADKVSLAEIARRLNEQGTKSKSGAAWYPTTVARVLPRGR
jgi:DNA invertase Pin-like site-specific DNA recombinase